jgi:hypothetical protein
MAKYTVGKGEIGAHAKTLVADTVDEVVFAKGQGFIEVVSDGAAEIYFTVDAPAPTVGGAAAYYLPALPCSRTVPSPQPGETVVRLISAGTPKYSTAKGRAS